MMAPFNRKFYLVFVFLFFTVCTFAHTQDISLSDSLRKAKKGDFVVTSQSKNLTLFHIFDVQDSTLIIEEISAPISAKKQIGDRWQQWVSDKAPGNTSWIIYELDLDAKKIDDVYSYSQKSWQKIYPGDQIFPTLINLKFSPLDDYERKKAGPKPLPEMIDDRPLWQPPIYSKGKKMKGIRSVAYKAYWPNDASDLSGKKIEIYLPQKNNLVPSYFPFWIQISNSFAQTKLHVIDSGFNLQSPHSHFPLPPPELISHQFNSRGELQFLIKTHPLFKDFNVYAKCTEEKEALVPISTVAYETANKRKAKLVIGNEELNNKLKAGRLYYFIFEPQAYSYMSIETLKPIGITYKHVHE